MSSAYPPHKSSIADADANIIALLSYLASTICSFIPVVKYVAWAAPLVIFFFEKNSGLVKFHSMQAFTMGTVSTLVDILGTIFLAVIGGLTLSMAFMANNIAISGLFAVISVVVGIAVLAVKIAFLILSILALLKAYKYEEYNIPVITKISQKIRDIIKR